MTATQDRRAALVEAVRRCADAGMSCTQPAAKLSTAERPLTKSAIIGLADRNGIKFQGNQFGGHNYVRVPKPKSKPKPTTPLITHVVSAKSDNWKTKPPPLRCSWACCECDAAPGDMFCFPHSRRSLMG